MKIVNLEDDKFAMEIQLKLKKKKNIMRKRMIAEIIYVQQKRERKLLFLLGIKFVCCFLAILVCLVKAKGQEKHLYLEQVNCSLEDCCDNRFERLVG